MTTPICRYLGIYWQEDIIPFFEKVKLTEGKTVRLALAVAETELPVRKRIYVPWFIGLCVE